MHHKSHLYVQKALLKYKKALRELERRHPYIINIRVEELAQFKWMTQPSYYIILEHIFFK